MSAILTCPKCREEISPTQTFCHCGARFKPGGKLPTFWRPAAAANKLEKICSKCGTHSVRAQSFCPTCGEKLPDVAVRVDSVHCPNCRSTQVAAGSEGFSTAKAVAGAVLLGPVGLVGGLIGSGKTMLTCLRCGHRFPPG